MRELLERDSFEALRGDIDERLARRELRRQIARLERELAGAFAAAFPRVEVEHRVDAYAAEPRVLDLGELERLRDELADRVAEAHAGLGARTELEAANRERLRQMIAAPAEHRWVRISRADLGEPGCGHWHSRPRLGPLGMLMGWWRVKVSSGCPLAGRLAAVEQEAQAEANAAGPGDEAEAGQRCRAHEPAVA